MKKLNVLMIQLQTKISKINASNTKVSDVTVGWHVEHVLLVINQIIAAVKASQPEHYKRKFSFLKTWIFFTKKIPRGKVRTPKSVEPATNFTNNSLMTHLQATLTSIETLSTLQPNNYFVHPYFGKLNVKETIKFLRIHTAHHLRIINDIIKG